MREFYINGNPPDMSMARRQNQVNPGCIDFDEVNHACMNHMCQNGKCVPSRDGQSYECKCKGGYSGPFCDQGKRDFHYFLSTKKVFFFSTNMSERNQTRLLLRKSMQINKKTKTRSVCWLLWGRLL